MFEGRISLKTPTKMHIILHQLRIGKHHSHVFLFRKLQRSQWGLAEIMKLLIIQVQVIVTLIQMLILSNPTITNNLNEQPSGKKTNLAPGTVCWSSGRILLMEEIRHGPEMYKTLKCINR